MCQKTPTSVGPDFLLQVMLPGTAWASIPQQHPMDCSAPRSWPPPAICKSPATDGKGAVSGWSRRQVTQHGVKTIAQRTWIQHHHNVPQAFLWPESFQSGNQCGLLLPFLLSQGAFPLACLSPWLASLGTFPLDLLTAPGSLLRRGDHVCSGYCQAVALDGTGGVVGWKLGAWTVYHRVLVI